MACPTCDHTMQKVNNGFPAVFWCPRCGSILSRQNGGSSKVPEIPDRHETPTAITASRRILERLINLKNWADRTFDWREHSDRPPLGQIGSEIENAREALGPAKTTA